MDLILSRRSFARVALALASVSMVSAGLQSRASLRTRMPKIRIRRRARRTIRTIRNRRPTKPRDSEQVYSPGGDVKAPKLTHYVEPEFSSSSNEAFVDGVVKIEAVVTAEGLPSNLKILSGLNTQEDKTAIEAVKQWRFRPGTKGDQPVKVRVTVEVNFHLL